MATYLHYDGTEIPLPDGVSLDALQRSIDAVAEGSGWMPVVDRGNVTHRLRITHQTHVRLEERPASGHPRVFSI